MDWKRSEVFFMGVRLKSLNQSILVRDEDETGNYFALTLLMTQIRHRSFVFAAYTQREQKA